MPFACSHDDIRASFPPKNNRVSTHFSSSLSRGLNSKLGKAGEIFFEREKKNKKLHSSNSTCGKRREGRRGTSEKFRGEIEVSGQKRLIGLNLAENILLGAPIRKFNIKTQ